MVELVRPADDDRPRADDEDGGGVGGFRHILSELSFRDPPDDDAENYIQDIPDTLPPRYLARPLTKSWLSPALLYCRGLRSSRAIDMKVELLRIRTGGQRSPISSLKMISDGSGPF